MELPDKKASVDDVFRFAMDKYGGNEQKARSYVRGWFSVK
jgi:hypothetical protein